MGLVGTQAGWICSASSPVLGLQRSWRLSTTQQVAHKLHIWEALSNVRRFCRLYHPGWAMLCGNNNKFKISLISNHQLSFWITLLSTLNQWGPLIILVTVAARLMERPSPLVTEAEGRAEHWRVSHWQLKPGSEVIVVTYIHNSFTRTSHMRLPNYKRAKMYNLRLGSEERTRNIGY